MSCVGLSLCSCCITKRIYAEHQHSFALKLSSSCVTEFRVLNSTQIFMIIVIIIIIIIMFMNC